MVDSVLILEDDVRIRSGFVQAIDAADDLRVVGTASSVADGLRMADALQPKVLLVDLALPDGHGITVIRHAARVLPQCLPIVVTIFDDDERVIDCIRAGAVGYLLKDARDFDLVREIRGVCNGGSPISAAIARRLFRWISTTSHTTSAAGSAANIVPPAMDRPADVPELSPRETSVLRLCSKGYRYEEIANLLAVSRSTVATHIKRIYLKLQVHSKAEAVYEARKLGFLDD